MNTPLIRPPFLGAHMSIAGGLHKAFERIQEVQGTALQIFVKNQRQWKTRPLRSDEIQEFAAAWTAWGEYPVAAHDTYLINLAAVDPVVLDKSLTGFAEELVRCETLGIPLLNTHPGSHMGAGMIPGLKRFTANLDEALHRSGTSKVTVLLENTAGQGTNMGSTFEELAWILEHAAHPDRMGVCFDTCHAFAAGYDLSSEGGYQQTFDRFDALIGLDRIRFFHLNDAKERLGAKRDRHAHIGQGTIGTEGFRRLMNDPRFARVPKVLETPKGKDLEEDRTNLTLLRSLLEQD
ncbi:MAG: deoxyribonuclease IV [Desulfovibrionales bacterium]